MFKGWFVGDFELSAFRTPAAEVCFMRHFKGEVPRPHHHKIATEITAIIRGKVQINDAIFVEGDVLVVEPNESVAPKILEDTEVIVVKVPSIPGDKYFDDIDSSQG
jgi:hypothetical protein